MYNTQNHTCTIQCIVHVWFCVLYMYGSVYCSCMVLCIVHVWFCVLFMYVRVYFILIKRFRCYIFVSENKNALRNRIFVLGKNCPFTTNNKNLGKRINNQNHTCTIHRTIHVQYTEPYMYNTQNHTCTSSQLFQRNGCKYKIQYYPKKRSDPY
jgi:hypothetical protein